MKRPPSADPALRGGPPSDKLGIGIDVALVTLLFLGLGYLLDRWLDTKPIFMIVLVCLALIGEFVRFWYAYDSKMKVLEAERAATTRGEPYKKWDDAE